MQSRCPWPQIFFAKTLNVVCIVSALVLYGSWAHKASAHDEQVRQQIAGAQRAYERGPYELDGTFDGTSEGYAGPITVRVVVQDGYVQSAEIVDSGAEDPSSWRCARDCRMPS